MEKIYDLVNRENGTWIRCSEQHLIEWVSRGFEVESFTYVEMSKEEPTQASPILHRKAAQVPHLSSNNIEYFSSLNQPIKKM
jgi:hypothetical protein